MGVTIEGTRKLYTSTIGPQEIVADLNVSTMNELPELGSLVEGCVIRANTIAHITQLGVFMKLDFDGTWYPAGNSAGGN